MVACMGKVNKDKNRMASLIQQYASTGQSSMLQLMMLAGVSPNIKGADGNTLAHHAALHAVATGNAEAIRKLTDYGGCMNVKNACGDSPMDILRAKPTLYAEVLKAVLRGEGQMGVKDANTVSGKSSLSDKKKRNQKAIKQLRGTGAAKNPLRRPRGGNAMDQNSQGALGKADDDEAPVLIIRPGGARS